MCRCGLGEESHSTARVRNVRRIFRVQAAFQAAPIRRAEPVPVGRIVADLAESAVFAHFAIAPNPFLF